ncbi:MAG: hypothetical protein OXE57_20900 [Alphaproteobacteria bacterium]|nr:hypothetical protein [Alphaproteobacteria bacterium]
MRLLVILNAAFLCAFAGTMALMILLNQQKFADILRGLDDSRVSVMTLDTSRRLRQAVDLGLPLKDIAESRSIVEALIEDYPELESVSIFDAGGRVLEHGGNELDTGRNEAPPIWVSDNRAADGEVWRIEDPESFIVGAPVVNNFGKLEGGVAVRYSKARYSSIVAGLLNELLEAAAIIFVASGLLAVLGTAAALWKLTKTARYLQRSVENLLKPDPDDAPADTDLVEFVGYSASVRETAATLAAAEGRER